METCGVDLHAKDATGLTALHRANNAWFIAAVMAEGGDLLERDSGRYDRAWLFAAA